MGDGKDEPGDTTFTDLFIFSQQLQRLEFGSRSGCKVCALSHPAHCFLLFFPPFLTPLQCLISAPPQRYAQILTPAICERDLVWKDGLCRGNQAKLRSDWIMVVLSPMMRALMKRPCEDTQTRREMSYDNAEIGVMCL